MLLLWKPVAGQLRQEVKEYVDKHSLTGKKVSFFLLSDNKPSQVYVKMKKKFAESVGLEGEIIAQETWSTAEVIEAIQERNADEECLWMIVQLPLWEHLQADEAEILQTMDRAKDLDGLWWEQFGRTIMGAGWFLPATPKAVMEILDFYDLGDLTGKEVVVLWQSNLFGKPFAVWAMSRGATVHSFNGSSDQERMRYYFHQADIVVSATWVVNLIDESFMDVKSMPPRAIPVSEKVFIDVWRGIKDWKAVGDIDQPFYTDRVKAITPVPGGVWPVTVASLFHNITVLWER